MIKAVIFDLDNTLVDFMAMKRQAIEAAIQSMIDAGLALTTEDVRQRINAIYQERGIEFQNVFDQLLYDLFQRVDYKILSAGIIAYRRAREAALVPYPHVYMTLMELLKRGLRLGVYLSPQDRKHGAAVGGKCADSEAQKKYNELYRRQLTEVLTTINRVLGPTFGDAAVHEVWFDGSVVVRRTSYGVIPASMKTLASAAALAAASQPSTSSDGSASAMPSSCIRASALSNCSPRSSAVRM